MRRGDDEPAWRARPGYARALRELDGPTFPDALAYLYQWSLELYGRSGTAFEGVAPLSFATLWYWAAFTQQWPTTDEVAALFRLDVVLRHPPDDRELCKQLGISPDHD